MAIRPEVLPFLAVALAFGLIVALVLKGTGLVAPRTALRVGVVLACVFTGYFLLFFRDPERVTPDDATGVVAGAEGVVAKIATLSPDAFQTAAAFCGLKGDDLKAFGTGDVVRISIFLSLFDVHVNRAPIAGTSRFLGYFPGKHLFTFTEKSSDVNQHNAILFEGMGTRCLMTQIVGPVARRVVYWPDKTRAVQLAKGARIGMMKFGSRLDMYFPVGDVTVTAKEGDRVRAGETIVARTKGSPRQ